MSSTQFRASLGFSAPSGEPLGSSHLSELGAASAADCWLCEQNNGCQLTLGIKLRCRTHVHYREKSSCTGDDRLMRHAPAEEPVATPDLSACISATRQACQPAFGAGISPVANHARVEAAFRDCDGLRRRARVRILGRGLWSFSHLGIVPQCHAAIRAIRPGANQPSRITGQGLDMPRV